MKYLAIDTSNDYLTVVLDTGEKLYTHFSPDGKIRHSVTLMPAVEELCERSGFDLGDVDFFCAVVGPGSFTGIRIGVSAIKGFADAFGKKVLGVTAFDLASYNDNVGEILSVVDAAHGNYYVCGYSHGEIVFGPKFIDESELLELNEDFTLYSYSDLQGFSCEKIDVVKGLVSAIGKRCAEASCDSDALKPFYLRLSQAEEGRK